MLRSPLASGGFLTSRGGRRGCALSSIWGPRRGRLGLLTLGGPPLWLGLRSRRRRCGVFGGRLGLVRGRGQRRLVLFGAFLVVVVIIIIIIDGLFVVE